MAEHGARYESDEALLRLEVPRVRKDQVDPPKDAATTEEPEGEAGPTKPAISVVLGPDGARITRHA